MRPSYKNQKIFVLSIIKKEIYAKLQEWDIEENDDNALKEIFIDDRMNGGLGLTKIGCEELSKHFPHWKIPYTGHLRFGDQHYLIAASRFPYFIDVGYIITFDEVLGTMFLMAGDFDTLKKTYPL